MKIPSIVLLIPALVGVSSLHAQASKSLHDASSPIQRPGPGFGNELQAAALKVGSTMDLAVVGDHVFAIGQGELRVLSNAREGKPVLIGELTGLGNTRQLVVSGGYAFITSREEGMFIVDVREPSAPKLVHHYDTAELATAIAVSGEVAAVGNRFAGIELLDVSTPAEPKHLATIRVGEVQSLVFYGTWLYAGTWAEKSVAVIDVRDPWKPRLVKTVPLDGKGDGLDVSGNLLAVATGHHARGKGHPKPGDAAFGAGHGVEFFDIADPADPKRLSGVKFPPFYRLGMDMWGVVLAGGHAFVNDTHNGFFLVDVRDPAKPQPVGWTQLPLVGKDPSPVAGIAVANGRVFLAGGFDDLHLVETGLDDAEPFASADSLRVPEPSPVPSSHGLPGYRVNGSIRKVLPWKDDLLLVAAGSAGWHIVRQTDDGFEPVAAHPTRGFARDVAFHGERIFVAESLGGLSIWEEQASGGMARVSAYEVPGRSIHQVVLADEGRIAFLAVGPNALHLIRIAGNGETELLMPPVTNAGLFYRDPFSPLSADGRRLLVQWHVTGLHEFLIENSTVKRGGWIFPHQMDTECGAAPWGDGWIATSRRGFFPLVNGETRSPDEIGLRRVSGGQSGESDRGLPGKPSVAGSLLFISDPFLGEVTAINLTKGTGTNPDAIARLQLSGHPGRVVMHRGKALIPAGREGLLMWEGLRTP
jgi:hypothetical protein